MPTGKMLIVKYFPPARVVCFYALMPLTLFFFFLALLLLVGGLALQDVRALFGRCGAPPFFFLSCVCSTVSERFGRASNGSALIRYHSLCLRCTLWNLHLRGENVAVLFFFSAGCGIIFIVLYGKSKRLV